MHGCTSHVFVYTYNLYIYNQQGNTTHSIVMRLARRDDDDEAAPIYSTALMWKLIYYLNVYMSVSIVFNDHSSKMFVCALDDFFLRFDVINCLKLADTINRGLRGPIAYACKHLKKNAPELNECFGFLFDVESDEWL